MQPQNPRRTLPVAQIDSAYTKMRDVQTACR